MAVALGHDRVNEWGVTEWLRNLNDIPSSDIVTALFVLSKMQDQKWRALTYATLLSCNFKWNAKILRKLATPDLAVNLLRRAVVTLASVTMNLCCCDLWVRFVGYRFVLVIYIYYTEYRVFCPHSSVFVIFIFRTQPSMIINFFPVLNCFCSQITLNVLK
jgi:hypothetical protein